MVSDPIVAKAEKMAREYHKGQYRIGGAPYIVHPQHVVSTLMETDFDDSTTLVVGWLHDTLEDTTLTCQRIRDVFGKTVADGVYILTRNVDRNAYKKRLLSATQNILAVKITDTLDNLRTLDCLTAKGIERKVADCLTFYIPAAKKIYPELGDRIGQIIKHYKTHGRVTPRVGDKVYIPTQLYLSHGADDFLGGLCRVSNVWTEQDGGYWISVKENTGGYNWSYYLLDEQEKLKKEYGRTRGRAHPDLRPEFNRGD